MVGKRLKVHVESERDHLGLRIGAAVIDAVGGLGRRREFGVEAREIGEGEQVAGRYVDADTVDLRLARPPLREGVAQRDILEFEIRAVLDESVRTQVMYELVKQKFQNPVYKEKLLSTGSCTLVEGNTHKDTFWGVYNGSGKNMLGKILMRVRNELQEDC